MSEQEARPQHQAATSDARLHAYERPTLVVHGTIERWTKNKAIASPDGGSAMHMNSGSVIVQRHSGATVVVVSRSAAAG